MDTDVLEQIRPRTKRLVFDLAEDAGHDTADWIASSRSQTKFKANPKYCYNWSLLTPDRVLVLNLWFDTMVAGQDGSITCSENYRQDAAQLRAAGGKTKWIERGLAFDRNLQIAASSALPIRVIVNDGTRRNRGDANAEPSRVDFRDLDPEPWHIEEYDRATGAFTLRRGEGATHLIDQFDIADALPARRDEIRSTFVRDPSVRRAALMRSGAKCELCGEEGFEMQSGSRYLETHHIVPLCEGGLDTVSNVIALCPNDHRRAHYAKDSDTLRERLIARIVK